MESHQDAKSAQPLDRWALLNAEMDLLAKLYWQEQFGAPVVNLPLEHEFWTFRIQGKKVSSYLGRQIRNHINGGAQHKRWERKGRLPPEAFPTMNWDACE